MKKTIFALLLCAVLILLSACGKSQAVKDVEKMISEIGEVSLEQKPAIQQANEALELLSDKEKESVENIALLIEANDNLFKAEYSAVMGEMATIKDRTDYSVAVIQKIWNNAGSTDFWTFYDAVVLFKKPEQSDALISFEGEKNWKIRVWAAGTALYGKDFDIYDLATTGSGRELADKVVNECVAFNQRYTNLSEDCESIGEWINILKTEYTNDYSEQIKALQDWYIELSLYTDLAANPKGSLSSFKSECNEFQSNIDRYQKIASTY